MAAAQASRGGSSKLGVTGKEAAKAYKQGKQAGAGKRKTSLSGTRRMGSTSTKPKYGLEGKGSAQYRAGFTAGKKAAAKKKAR